LVRLKLSARAGLVVTAPASVEPNRVVELGVRFLPPSDEPPLCLSVVLDA
jgi:hypothetical protein